MTTMKMELRQIDHHNRITLSAQIRKQMGITRETLLKLEVIDGAIVLKPVVVVDKETK